MGDAHALSRLPFWARWNATHEPGALLTKPLLQRRKDLWLTWQWSLRLAHPDAELPLLG